MAATFENDWQELLKPEFAKPYYQELRAFLAHEYKTQTIYPNMYDIFGCLHGTAYKDVKVVILGQDPYHGPGQAHGYSFSVRPGVQIPPSLMNIYKELESDLGCYIPNNGYLKKWADQGVLMLNAVLTVRAGQAGSHRGKGWETFTDEVIKQISDKTENVVFMLWGNYAKVKGKVIDTKKHLILNTVHPSPLSVYRGFFGCKHFSRANEYLTAHGKTPINW